MNINEDNYREIINSFLKEEWRPLLDLIPEIEKTADLIKTKHDNEAEASQALYQADESLMNKFLEAVYEIPIIIDFKWSAWDEGRKIINNPSFNFNTLDIPDKCRVITAIVRGDRFNQGLLGGALKSGLILNILKSIEEQL